MGTFRWEMGLGERGETGERVGERVELPNFRWGGGEEEGVGVGVVGWGEGVEEEGNKEEGVEEEVEE